MIDAKGFTAKLESTKRIDSLESAIKNVGGVAAADSDLPENELLMRQLVFSDRIFINKIDLLPSD